MIVRYQKRISIPMLQEYDDARGWDVETGLPAEENVAGIGPDEEQNGCMNSRSR